MAAIAKFVSYDGGIAFSDSVMLLKKGDDAPSYRIPLSDVASVSVKKPQEDADGFIRVATVGGQRCRLFFEDDQYREAVRFKRQFDAFLGDIDTGAEQKLSPERASVDRCSDQQRTRQLSCPKCGSTHIDIQVMQENQGAISSTKTKSKYKEAGHSILWWIFIGSWWWIFDLIIWIVAFIPRLLLRIGRKKKYKGRSTSTTTTKNIIAYRQIFICKNCGHTWSK